MKEFLNQNQIIIKRTNKIEMGFDSLGAKPLRLLALLLALKDTDTYIPEVIQKKANIGLTAYSNAVRELVKTGYMKLEKIKNKNGKFEKTKYYISDTPEFKEENSKLTKGIVHYIKQDSTP